MERTLFPAPTVFFSTDQSAPEQRPPSLWVFTAGSHSSGMNLSRLEHSAKGHYPGLHVCWAAVLSNSTRCCCDDWVTCEGRVSICTAQPALVTPPPVSGPCESGREAKKKRAERVIGAQRREVCGSPRRPSRDFIWWQIMGWINGF